MKNLKLPLLYFFFFYVADISAQRDTQFWFAAPEISQGHTNTQFDSPVLFRFSTYDQPATVTISQPANPSFTTRTVSVPAQSSDFFIFPPDFQFVENNQPDQIRNIGFLIESSNPISVYYEVVGVDPNNPELYSMKGRNALGLEFFLPFQNMMRNSNGYDYPPFASFDIVASENNTTVTITPTKDLVNHGAGVSYTKILNRGQTYSGWATGQLASDHPSGTRVVADKPVAITIKDDLLEGGIQFGGACRDQLGDQIIPVNKIGTKYVIQQGDLSGQEKAFVIGTQTATEVKYNGSIIGNVNAGEIIQVALTSNIGFIETSKPVYVHQVTGIGCETAGEVLPPFDCTGSTEIRFVRSSTETFYMFLATRIGNEDAFILNNNNTLIQPLSFAIVPGSNNEFVAAKLYFNTVDVPALQSSVILNTKGAFQMGFVNGEPIATGCRFGYFSDFGKFELVEESIQLCSNESAVWHGINVAPNIMYYDTTKSQDGCDTVWRLSVIEKNYEQKLISFDICFGSSIVIDGIEYTPPVVVTDTLLSNNGCDTIVTYSIGYSSVLIKNIEIGVCAGELFEYEGILYDPPTEIIDTIFSISGCDTVFTISVFTLPTEDTVVDTLICLGESITISGISYNSPQTIIDTIQGASGCDSILIYELEVDIPITNFLPADTNICDGENIFVVSPYQLTIWNGSINSQSILIEVPGIYIANALSANGCPVEDSIVVAECCGEGNIYVPNVFNPDAPPPNNVFRAFPSDICVEYKLSVFHRWGGLIFESTDPEVGWDGRLGKRYFNPGLYIWIIELYRGTGRDPLVLSGSVALIR